MKAIIRDDDINFFTTPAMLRILYDDIWEAGNPVCLSVVPTHAAVEVPFKHIRQILGSRYDLNIPPPYRGSQATYHIGENRELCDFLNQKINEGLVEICLHGLTHTDEFFSSDRKAIRKDLETAREILHQVFPDAALKTVVPPYEILTKTAIQTIFDSQYNLSTDYESYLMASNPGLARLWAWKLKKKFFSDLPDDTIIRQRESALFFGVNLFPSDGNPQACLSNGLKIYNKFHRRKKTLICVNHYHYFFKNWQEPRKELVESWKKFIKQCAANQDFAWTTFAEHA